MAEWIEGIKCMHNITCGIMLSILLSLAIRAHINFASSSCDITGEKIDAGNSKCQMTNDRIWTLALFYGGAAVFAIGTLATCMSNGYLVIFYLLCASVWLGTVGGLTIYRMISNEVVLIDGFYSIVDEVIPDKWGVYSTIVQWVLGISLILTMLCLIVMVFHFLQYKYV